MSNLVIVESPAKAKTIGRILGAEYEVLASMGHVRDLPQRSLGVDVANDFAPNYVENKDRGKVIGSLRSAAKKAEKIYLAPDPDREGEAIAWHLKELLSSEKGKKKDFFRTTFHEITAGAVQRAFETPGEIEMTRVESQQARRILDRLVGYQISRLLWSRIERGISAGRVQSVALRLVCEREREIQAFKPQEYWNFEIDLTGHGAGNDDLFTAKLAKINGDKFLIDNSDDAAKVLAAVNGAPSFQIAAVESKPRNRNPFPPFITSTMQQAASAQLRFSASYSMRVAQQLYEGVDTGSGGPIGLITYMRTDSVTVAKEAQEACRNFISAEMGPQFVPSKPNFYRSKESAQGAHEAIRPTDVTLTPEKLKPYLDESQMKLYTLIWRRFVASQMAPARQQRTTVDTMVKGADGVDYLFRTVATVTTFPGFMKVYNEARKGDDEEVQQVSPALAKLKTGDLCDLIDAKNEQKFTEPPPRFSEATLIRELESNGIGRPSTYASIVNTIQKREYVAKEKGKLSPSELGFRVNDYLVDSLPDLFQVGFTAEMEKKLDEIEEGDVKWTDMLREFYGHFDKWLNTAKLAGAPEKEKVGHLLAVFDQVTEWEPPVKKGKRTYNDQKFYNSVKDKFLKDGVISEKQWLALIRLGAQYGAQIPNLDQVAGDCAFSDELIEARSEVAARIERLANAEKMAGQVDEKLIEAFNCFSKVTWEPPVKKGARTFDDSKFYESLKNQAEQGRNLSEKQRRALANMANKYRDSILDYEKLLAALQIDPAQLQASAQIPPETLAEMKKYLEILAKVEKWAEPVKKGRRVYDDKQFHDSIAKQVDSGKSLSPRQIQALKKLAGKYS